MKKIVLALMMMVSASFADWTQYHSVTTGETIFYLNHYCLVGSPTTSGTSYVTYGDKPSECGKWYISDDYHVQYMQCTDTGTNIKTQTVTYPMTWVNSCPSGQSVDANGECVAPEPETCDPIGAKYTSTTTGQCVDCMPFQTFSQRASCACDSQGSSYSPQGSLTYDYVTPLGGYTYKKTNVTCDNGQRVAVYYDPVSNTPVDNNNTTPTDNNNTTPPKDTNTTTPTDGNNTTTPTTPSTPSQADVIKAVNDSAKAMTDSVKSVDTNIQAVNTTLQASNTKLDTMVSKITDSNTLLTTTNSVLSSTKDILSAEFKKNDEFRVLYDTRTKEFIASGKENSANEVSATKDVSSAVHGTTNAVNTQGDKLGGKLDDILQAIKDSNGTGKEGNGTDMTPTNDLLEKIKGDTNATVKGLDKLHEDINGTNSLLDKISGFFDNNDSYKTPDVNGTEFELSDLLPDESWFETNKLTLNFNNYGGDCYCQTAEFTVAGKTFIFPPQEALDVIPFNIISNIFMAFIFVLGAKDFLRE